MEACIDYRAYRRPQPSRALRRWFARGSAVALTLALAMLMLYGEAWLIEAAPTTGVDMAACAVELMQGD
jgi:hypothetical protein